jgi:DNA-binding CsgD family transcriptional regulator
VQTLARSPARLEQAHALVELGSALRRTNRLGQAVEPLRAGLDLAERCGAARLADRAGDELRSAGARPRRRRIHGPLSLTASELRVARLAAAGLTNREIARRVYVTPKTVENQLRSVYQKLGVTGRDRLADALAAE